MGLDECADGFWIALLYFVVRWFGEFYFALTGGTVSGTTKLLCLSLSKFSSSTLFTAAVSEKAGDSEGFKWQPDSYSWGEHG